MFRKLRKDALFPPLTLNLEAIRDDMKWRYRVTRERIEVEDDAPEAA